MQRTPLDRLILAQDGVVRRDQLAGLAISRDTVRANLRADRWVRRSSTVVTTFTGTPTAIQQQWIAVLHGGPDALLGGLAAASAAGLKNWAREEIPVYIPADGGPARPAPDFARYIRTRRDLRSLRAGRPGVPRLRLEPAVLLWAANQSSPSTIRGALSACVQQRLTDPAQLLDWIDRLAPLARSPLMRDTLEMITGGAHSNAEMNLKRLCQRFGLQPPVRQTKRRDAHGHVRFTDAEWRTADGRTVVLEIDGAFHMEVEHWEADMARARALSSPLVNVLQCTAEEAGESAELAADLVRLGVPRAA
ncbi:hypothetical protein Back2_13880 [Nocardioides baekrokdamisoli]|uniref:DUF559 domain-containing protein n=1 Tax=Nocardioides baekrokdamisoli TaxID=1804624 RepID=A0A3G9ITZ7_9ACTN|nr:hypothetical protein [Nocardioides baekrokdamisoli]BBH17101.1 hypothetical protein Back2_13880 [Nocardioides baekrokdamisoli]